MKDPVSDRREGNDWRRRGPVRKEALTRRRGGSRRSLDVSGLGPRLLFRLSDLPGVPGSLSRSLGGRRAGGLMAQAPQCRRRAQLCAVSRGHCSWSEPPLPSSTPALLTCSSQRVFRDLVGSAQDPNPRRARISWPCPRVLRGTRLGLRWKRPHCSLSPADAHPSGASEDVLPASRHPHLDGVPPGTCHLRSQCPHGAAVRPLPWAWDGARLRESLGKGRETRTFF